MYIAQSPQNCPDFRGVDVIDWTVHNAGVTPHFFTEKVKRKNTDGTETELDIECVTIVVAGDMLTECSLPVDDQLRERFADEYAAWKDGRDTLSGTPVTEWKSITARQATFLEANNIFSVESLAALTDGNIHNVTDGRELRDKAIRWLKTKAASSEAEENAKLRAEVAGIKKWKAEVEGKPKRKPMAQEQRDKISARQKARHAEAQRGLAALAEAASVTCKSENQVSGEEVFEAI